MPAPTAVPPDPASITGGGCGPNFAGACVPLYLPDINCPQIPAKNLQVIGYDPHGLDGDNGRVGCEA